MLNSVFEAVVNREPGRASSGLKTDVLGRNHGEVGGRNRPVTRVAGGAAVGPSFPQVGRGDAGLLAQDPPTAANLLPFQLAS